MPSLLPRSALLLGLLLTLAAPAHAQSRFKPVVAIDPGHGGQDAGVDNGGWLEKDLVLEIAFVIGAEFVSAGFDVVYTRTQDEAVEWDDRRRIAEDAGAAVLLMLHANGNENPAQHGAEIYANLDELHHSRLADAVSDSFLRMGSAVRVEPRPWPFLASRSAATAMIELAFMTNPTERRLLADSDFHHELGRALASAAWTALDGPR